MKLSRISEVAHVVEQESAHLQKRNLSVFLRYVFNDLSWRHAECGTYGKEVACVAGRRNAKAMTKEAMPGTSTKEDTPWPFLLKSLN